MLRFDVFGRHVGVTRADGRWIAVFLGAEGKHRAGPAIPPSLPESELETFLADLFHESARPDKPNVIRLGSDGGAP